jgi:hypothetical protein
LEQQKPNPNAGAADWLIVTMAVAAATRRHFLVQNGVILAKKRAFLG